jgi:hypothetical protein
MIYLRIFNLSNTTGVSIRPRTSNPNQDTSNIVLHEHQNQDTSNIVLHEHQNQDTSNIVLHEHHNK